MFDTQVETAKSGVVWVVDRADAACNARTGALGWCRRLLFLESVSGAVQSEVRLLAPPPSAGGGVARAVDRRWVLQDYRCITLHATPSHSLTRSRTMFCAFLP